MKLGRMSAVAVATALAALGSAPAANAAVIPVFNPQAGTLSVFGDAAANQIVIGRDQLGVITVNGQVPQAGGEFPTVFNTRTMRVNGGAGTDVLLNGERVRDD
jgi:hypothetical protein